MKKRNIISSLFWMVFGTLFIIGAWQQGLVKKGVPGPGFLPFICGIALIGLSLVVLIAALGKDKNKKTEEVGQEKFFPEKESGRRVVFALTAPILYAIFLPYLGFLLTTFVFMLFMLRLMEPQKWYKVFLVSFFTAVLAYLLFAALEVQLPRGILGI
jgi:putative tricarboxylic transport membrane protein